MKRAWISMVLAAALTVTGAAFAAAPTPVANPRFYEMRKKLDDGGTFYLYVDLQGAFRDLAEGLTGSLRAAGSGMTPDEQQGMEWGCRAIDAFFGQLSLYHVQDLGMSVAPDGDLNRLRVFVGVPAEAKGLRQALGGAPTPRQLLTVAPETTVLLYDTDFFPGLLYAAIQEGYQQSAPVERKNELELGIIRLEGLSGLPLRKILQSLGGEMGLVVTLDESNPIRLPGANSRAVTLPKPGVLVALQARDSLLYDSLKKLFAAAGASLSDLPTTTGLQGYTIAVPPLPIPVQPTVAYHDGLFFFSTDASLLVEGLQRRREKKGGLAAVPEFTSIFKDLPPLNNGVTYISPRLAPGIAKYLTQVPAMAGSPILGPLGSPRKGYASVRVNEPDGVLFMSRTESAGGEIVAAGFMAPVGILAGVAVPGFLRAREVSRRNACQENLVTIDAAKAQWALEKNMPGTAAPTWDDLVRADTGYLRAIPQCPCGGTYTIGPVNDPPRCSYQQKGDFAHPFPIPQSNQ